jgi:hypothetical protein
MNYTFFAISCYILMRSLEVLLRDVDAKKSKVWIKAAALLAFYAALSSMIVWFYQLRLLGFDPTK